jgi:Zn-dependent protease with chaperone function
MSPLEDFLPPPHTVLYLANVALAAVLTCGTALLAVFAGRRRSAPTRHGLLLLALVLVLTSPAFVWLAGRAGVGRLQVTLLQNREPNVAPRVVPNTPGPSVDVPQDPQVLASEAARRHPGSASERPASPLDARIELPANSSPGPERLVEKVANPAGSAGSTSWSRWWLLGRGLALAWAAGTVVSLAWLLCGLVRLAAFCRELDPVDGDAVPIESDQGSERLPTGPGRSPNLPGVRPAAARAAAQVGLARLPRLFTAAQTPTPVTFGLFCPAVVLPEGLADDLPPDQLDAVLVHEMAQVVRRDPWVGLLQRLAAAFFWWCPLVQRLNRRLAEVREEVCDNYVLCSQDDGASLAEVLVALAERLASPAPLPATVSMLEYRRARERSRALEQRIRRLLSTETSPMTRMNRVSLLLVVLAGVGMTVAIALSHVRAAGEDVPVAASPTRASSTCAG